METEFKNVIRNKLLRSKGTNFYMIRELLYQFGMAKVSHFLKVYDRVWKTNYSN